MGDMWSLVCLVGSIPIGIGLDIYETHFKHRKIRTHCPACKTELKARASGVYCPHCEVENQVHTFLAEFDEWWANPEEVAK